VVETSAGTNSFTGNNFGTGSDDTYTLALGDVNGDGYLDIAVGNGGGQNVVYLGDGDGTFDTTSFISAPARTIQPP
jgi:hypothetical protein